MIKFIFFLFLLISANEQKPEQNKSFISKATKDALIKFLKNPNTKNVNIKIMLYDQKKRYKFLPDRFVTVNCPIDYIKFNENEDSFEIKENKFYFEDILNFFIGIKDTKGAVLTLFEEIIKADHEGKLPIIEFVVLYPNEKNFKFCTITTKWPYSNCIKDQNIIVSDDATFPISSLEKYILAIEIMHYHNKNFVNSQPD